MSTENIFSLYAIETDGSRVGRSRDPPGQRSVYIAPGDTFRETYRLATFKNYPRNVRQDPRRLAANGFFYTGYHDRVKCFSCGSQIEKWLPEDDPSSCRWHADDCDFFNQRDESNIPINSMFARFGISRERNPRPNRTQRPLQSSNEAPIQNGFDVETVPHVVQPSAQLKQNHVARPQPTNSVRRNLTVSTVTQQSGSVGSPFQDLFPCRFPINPHMRSEEARLQTFLDHSNTWPAFRISATPREIVEAGMYYLGERDRVKCWYCNGGLQNWELNDIPWTEHAKWFPMCEFVLQKKGPQFVHEIVSQFPNLRRPILSNATNSFQLNVPELQSNVRSSRRSTSNSSSSHLEIVDPRKEQELRKKKIAEEMKSSTLVAQARIMGFSNKEIENTIKKQYERFDVGFSNFESLVEALLSNDSSETPVEGSASQELPNGGEEAANPVQELRELENQRMCRRCHREPANVVFIPCGHLVCCKNCSDNVNQCPTCKCYIREKVRSYLS